MAHVSDIVSEMRSWLLAILNKDNLKDLSVDILGQSQMGDGYTSDIYFVHVFGVTHCDLTKEYDLVLKCRKKVQKLRNTVAVKHAFQNEIFMYNTVHSILAQFQKEKGTIQVFGTVPKCYGTFSDQNMDVLVFENLKIDGYDLWSMKKPMTRKHIDMIIEGYGKFHAVSVAMNDQEPEKFKSISSSLISVLEMFIEKGNLVGIFETIMEELCDLLQNDLEENVLMKWKELPLQAHFILNDMIKNVDGLKVIIHGDCWNNNFMFRAADGIKNEPTDVAFIDWQLSKLSSPIFDLSYFLFCCISKEDLENLDDILKEYYKSFSDYLEKLGSNPAKLYPYEQFISEWEKYCKFGIVMAPLLMKMCSVNKDETTERVKPTYCEDKFSQDFIIDIKNKRNFKNRMQHIVEYVVNNRLF